MAEAGVSLGKGAWDCDANSEIPPEKEASCPAETLRPSVLRSWTGHCSAHAAVCPQRQWCRQQQRGGTAAQASHLLLGRW